MTDSDAAVVPAPEPIPPPKPRILARLARRGYLLLALLCVLIWLPGIVSLPALDRDESRFAESSRQMIDSGNYVDIRFGQVPRYKKPVGIYWLQSAATAVAGFGDHTRIWTYRLPSLLGGILAVWLTFWCGALFSAEAGFVAGLLMAASLLLTAEANMATTDAVQLAAIAGMQGVLLRVWRAAKESLPPPSRLMVLAGWAALAVGILVKGPVAPAVAAVTIIALILWDRFEKNPAPTAEPVAEDKPAAKGKPNGKPAAVAPEQEPAAPAAPPAPARKIDWRWLAGTNPLSGIALTILLTAPWLIAIALASHGAFFQQSLGGDFATKLAGGQEGHGALPGYYLLLSALTLWPGVLAVLPGIGLGLSRRREPLVRFLIAWAGVSWLMMELVPTKLPNYVLPAFPPLAILAALWLLAPRSEAMPGWRRFLPWIAALQFLIGLGAIATATLLLPKYYAAPGFGAAGLANQWPLLLAVGLGGLAGLVALVIFLTGRRLMALTPALLAAVILFPTLTAGVGPRLDQLWISQRLALLVAKDRQQADPPPILAGFEEPSLVFALGADVDLTDGRGAAEHGAVKGGLALVDDAERPRFLARLAELEANAIAVDDLEGFNYSRGKRTHITLYRVAPRDPGSIPTVR